MPIGLLKTIKDFYIPQLKTKRRIWIYLPPEYENSQKRYPVLYMHDGQSLFAENLSYDGSWHVDTIIDKLFNNKKTEGVIIVAVDNAGKNRMREYNPWEDMGGRGQLYSDFLIQTLKPYIDDSFRTMSQREYTGIMGSSMGGYISTYIALKNQDIFSKVGLLSPAYWLYTEQLNIFLKNALITKPMKIYLSVGTKEGDEERSNQYLKETKATYDILSDKIGDKIDDGNDIKLDIIQNGTHSASEWSKTFEAAFTWLY